jgi:hypothetical protein
MPKIARDPVGRLQRRPHHDEVLDGAAGEPGVVELPGRRAHHGGRDRHDAARAEHHDPGPRDHRQARLLEAPLVGVAIAEERLAGREGGGGPLDPCLVARPIPDREPVDRHHQAQEEREDGDERPH